MKLNQKSKALVSLRTKKIKSPYMELKQIKIMSKEITLTISERVVASQIINAYKGNIDELSLMLEGIKQIAITPEEWVSAELVKTPILGENGQPSGQESWNWNDHSPELDKALTLDSAVVLYILNAIKAKEEKGEITMADKALITLKPKLQ